MKILIAGAGEVGTHLAKMLSYEGHDLTIIDIKQAELKNVDLHLDLLTIDGSALSFDTLKEAKVEEKDLFIAVTHFPEMNIASAIIAKKLGAKKCIARVRHSEHLKQVNRQLFRELGIDSVVYPQQLAAQEIYNFLKQAATREVFDFSNGKISLFVIKLNNEAPIVGKNLFETGNMQKELDFRAVAILRNNTTIIPRGSDVFMENDQIYVVSNRKRLSSLLDFTGKHEVNINNIMILGGSRTGKATALLLENHFDVKLIEQDEKQAERLANDLANTLVVCGDGRNTDLLVEEGIRKMDAFVAVTGNSETNILACQLAKRLGVKKTIAQVENVDYLDLAENMNIDTIINKKFIAASHIYKHTFNVEVSEVKYLNQTDAEVLEFIVNDDCKIISAPLNQIDFPKDAIIGGVVRGSDAFIAKGASQILPKDRVLVICRPHVVSDVQKFFE
jgi:trk system potassium uptake protein